jgi:PAS domain S-box-containing protein
MGSAQSASGSPVPLESVICTQELNRRQARQPDLEAVTGALVALAKTMANAPERILQDLVETALHLCFAHSAGISLLEEEDGRKIFRWRGVAGQYAPHLWGTTPREFSPCGTVLDTNTTQLMSYLDRHFSYFAEVAPRIAEALLVPFHVDGEAVGTIWIVSHDDTRKFDAEDARVMTTLGEFAAAAYQVVSTLNELNAGRLSVEQVNAPKAQLAAIVESSEDAIISKDLTGTIQTWNVSAEQVYGYSAEEAIGRSMRLLLPSGREDEEQQILDQIRRGQRVYHFETTRVRKGGSLIDVSLTISPIRNTAGNIIGASHVARDITERKVLEEQARRAHIHQLLLERTFSAQEEERCRIARELHDEAGQLLASLLVGLRTLEDFENIEDAKAKARLLREITVQTIDEVGRLARGLHPMILDDYGLRVALSRYVSDYTNTHNIAVNLIVGNCDPGNLSRAIQIGLYRILQEALTNVARHSEAKAVGIAFICSGAVLEVAVSDDGCGFDTAADFVSTGHLGIQSMRERAAMLGGTVRIASEGKGTQVLVRIPLTEEDLQRLSPAGER